ncbi:MAG: alpha/beta hydrolase [Actinomycetota bacterium]|nr:alpha/beta hydrolase [Actinomycetota bacterium]
MHRRAFEVTADWDDVEENELDPPPLKGLRRSTPTVVLVGALDLDAILHTARRVTDGIAAARLVDWPDTAHLPSMERPVDFLALVGDWLARRRPPDLS